VKVSITAGGHFSIGSEPKMSRVSPRQVPTSDRNQKYRPISVNSLRLDSELPFTLYTQIEGEFLIYRRENLPFTDVQRDALIENELETLYVSPDQIPHYCEYVGGGIRHLLDDGETPVRETSAALYQSTEELSRRIVATPIEPENLELAQEVVTGTLEFSRRGKTTLHGLMSQMAEEPSLHSHALNVCQYGLVLARELNALAEEELESFGIGIMLMDLGMLQLPEGLIFKDGPLSFDEWSLIKRHPALSLEMIDGLPGVPDLAREVIFGHHERLDGSGYPQALRGAEISLPLRIVGVVDTFASLTTLGSHRHPLSTFDALRELHAELAPGFDPEVLRAFVSVLGE